MLFPVAYTNSSTLYNEISSSKCTLEVTRSPGPEADLTENEPHCDDCHSKTIECMDTEEALQIEGAPVCGFH